MKVSLLHRPWLWESRVRPGTSSAFADSVWLLSNAVGFSSPFELHSLFTAEASGCGVRGSDREQSSGCCRDVGMWLEMGARGYDWGSGLSLRAGTRIRGSGMRQGAGSGISVPFGRYGYDSLMDAVNRGDIGAAALPG